MVENEIYRHYLADLGHVLAERALEAKSACEQAKSREEREFASGQLMAYYAVISLMQQQAEAFQLSPADLNMGDLVADRDLL